MPVILVARFETLPDAASAAHALVGEGFREDAVCVFRAAEGERWPGQLVHVAMARAAALGAAGASIGVAAAVAMNVPDAYIVLVAAVAALFGYLLATLFTRLERRGYSDGRLPTQAAFVAVVTQAGQEDKGAQLLRDAGGRSMERLRQRHIVADLIRGREDMQTSLRTGFPI
ncbi:hypothetical protein CAL12_17670 [Bordetella genomosp. 8]|uniref:Uncharacterized protein n=1 Tax=Bordetella genomosp. 8 TaxID=1416806 RepID=A0A1W6YN34_9BORD|nr:hypothetical protein [Bordetella genomosp. 8]ARP82465.1 hypothetical protein CAL12_17670 [Bordetella genomosp. 8]